MRSVLVVAAVAAVPGYRLLAPASSAASDVAAAPRGQLGAPSEGDGIPRSARGTVLGEADGAVPAGTTVFDDTVAAVGNLDPALRAALRRATTAAGTDGVRVLVDSGWRSRAYQERLLDDAIAKYGSRAEAARWVATPDTSAHVSGHAVDVGPAKAAAWLSKHGAAYGLCQIYRNEPWHYELRAGAATGGCPAMYADAAHDPRLRQ